MQHLRLRIAHAVTLLPTGGIAFVKHACRCLVRSAVRHTSIQVATLIFFACLLFTIHVCAADCYLQRIIKLVLQIAMNVLKPTSGRKRESPIWGYFAYDAPMDKSRCTALDNGMRCGQTLTGKNPTNLATHLRTAHKEVYADCGVHDQNWPVESGC